MPHRGDVFKRNHYYHLYNRGFDGGQIFFNPANYEHCTRLVKRYRRRYGAVVIAYCLMPNHYHFLLRQETDIPLSKFISALFNAYVQAVNRQQGRKGPLFEGRFRHVRVDHEEYLLYLCRYIHLNPVKAKMVSRPEDWLHSNYLEWLDPQAGNFTDESFIRTHFPTPEAYAKFVNTDEDEMQELEAVADYVWD